MYNAEHQAKKYKEMKKKTWGRRACFPSRHSQNYVDKYETETQATHFGASKKAISLHTGLLYRYDEEKVKVKTFCTDSHNLDHNAYAVWAHMKHILQECSVSYPNSHTIHIFFDSPTSQYRNRAIYLMTTIVPSVSRFFLKYMEFQ